MTQNEALRKSIKMWEWLSKTCLRKEAYFRAYPEEERPKYHDCYLCDIYLYDAEDGGTSCSPDCPLYQGESYTGFSCSRVGHPFSMWAGQQSSTNAQAVLDMLKKALPKAKYLFDFFKKISFSKNPVSVRLFVDNGDIITYDGIIRLEIEET